MRLHFARRMLSEECTTIEENIDRHQKVLSDLHSDIRLAERRVKGLTSMVENLRREKSEKEAQLAALENDMNSRKDDALAIFAEKEKLEKELVAIQGKLADKQEKLQTADRQLSDFIKVVSDEGKMETLLSDSDYSTFSVTAAQIINTDRKSVV